MKVETETKPYDTINVTPMLDLAYVLLVIFIIMTTATVQGLKINLPKPSNKPSLVQKEVRIVQILPDGSLLLNGTPAWPGDAATAPASPPAEMPTPMPPCTTGSSGWAPSFQVPKPDCTHMRDKSANPPAPTRSLVSIVHTFFKALALDAKASPSWADFGLGRALFRPFVQAA